MESIAFLLMACVVVEALIEYYKTIYKMVENKDYKTAITQGVTIVFGVLAAFWFNLHLFNGVLSEIYEELKTNPINPTIDIILTGILISRGSNYFSDLISKLTGKKDVFMTPDDLVYDPSAPTDTLTSTDGKAIGTIEEEEGEFR